MRCGNLIGIARAMVFGGWAFGGMAFGGVAFFGLAFLGLAFGLALFDQSTFAAAAESVNAPQDEDAQDKVDVYGDPLPKGAIARLGKVGAEAGEEEAPPYHTHTVQDVQFSADGKMAATCGLDLDVRIWDPATGEQLHHFANATHPFGFSPDGKYFLYTAIAGFSTQELRVWDFETKQDVGKTSEPVDTFAFRKSDGLLLRAFNGRLTTCRLPSLENAGLQRPSFARILAISPDGEYIVSAASETVGEIRVYRSGQSSSMVRAIPLGARERARRLRVAVSPDNRMLAVAGDTHVIFVWELATGTQLHRFIGHRRDIHDIEFSPDGKFLVTAGLGASARIWNLSTWKEVESHIEQAEEIKAIAFAPDGSRLATASSDRTALVWELAPDLAETAQPQPLTAERFDKLWQDLASNEPNLGFHAASELFADMPTAVPLIQERIDEILQPSQSAKIQDLIADLDSDEFMVREQATEELIRFRDVAIDELNHALQETRSPEVKHRIKRILSTPEDKPRFSPLETARMVRVIDLLARDGGEESIALLQTLAKGFPSREIMRAAQLALAEFGDSGGE